MTVRTRGFGGGGGGDGFTQTVADGLYIPKSLLTTQGDLIYASAANTPARLPAGTAGQILRMNSGATAPEWVSGGMHLIASSVLGSPASSIGLSSIPAGFTALKLVVHLRSDRAANNDTWTLSLNSDTTDANYSWYQLGRNNGANFGAGITSSRAAGVCTAASANAAAFGDGSIDIPLYAGSGWKVATIQGQVMNGSSTSSTGGAYLASLQWQGTAAVTAITFAPVTGSNFATGSAVYLYGIG